MASTGTSSAGPIDPGKPTAVNQGLLCSLGQSPGRVNERKTQTKSWRVGTRKSPSSMDGFGVNQAVSFR